MKLDGVDFYEYCDPKTDRFPQFQRAIDAAQATRKFRVASATDDDGRHLADEAVLGYNVVRTAAAHRSAAAGGNGVRRWIERGLPDFYPATAAADELLGRPVFPWLFATSIANAEPITGKTQTVDGDGSPTYRDGYSYTVTYRGRDYDLRPDAALEPPAGGSPLSQGGFDGTETDATAGEALLPAIADEGYWVRARSWTRSRFISRTTDNATYRITLPDGSMFFDIAAAATPAGRKDYVRGGWPLIVPRVAVTYCHHLVPCRKLDDDSDPGGIPAQAMIRWLGKTNFGAFDGMPPGTLLFKDFKIIPRQDGVAGDRLADVFLFFLFQPNVCPQTGVVRGWNSQWRKRDGKIFADPVSTDGEGSFVPYPPVGLFDELFRPDQGYAVPPARWRLF